MSVDPIISAYFSALGKRSASGMTAEQRRSRAIKANRTRLEKRGLLTVSNTPEVESKTPALLTVSKQEENDLDRCSRCNQPRYKHRKYSTVACALFQR